jgi:SAP domain-containing ribonucleoprotein
MTDYSQLKVPELKKLLQEKSLPISGNKADLVARLQEADKKPATDAPGRYSIFAVHHSKP